MDYRIEYKISSMQSYISHSSFLGQIPSIASDCQHTQKMAIQATATYLPPRRRENMLVTLVVTSLNNLPCVRFILLNGGVGEETDVVVYVKVEEGARLAASLVDNEVVESIVLKVPSDQKRLRDKCASLHVE